MEHFFSLLGITSEQASESFLSYVPNILGALVTITLFVLFYLFLARVVNRSLERTNLAPSLRRIIVGSFLKWVMIIFALIMTLNQLGVDVTAAIAGVGVAGIALGFAAKETLSNMLAGLSIFIDKLYVTGDWVEIVDHYGQVKEITLRTTKIRTLDNIFVIIPNNEITTRPVTNFSEDGEVRVTANISIGYSESVEQVRQMLTEAVAKIEGVRKDPAPDVVVEKLGESSVDLLVRMWVDDAGSDPAYRFQLTEICKKVLDDANVEIPFPQRVVQTK